MLEQRQALKLVLLVEDGVWPEYTLHEEGTWAAHRKLLSLEQRHAEVKQHVWMQSCSAPRPCAARFVSPHTACPPCVGGGRLHAACDARVGR